MSFNSTPDAASCVALASPPPGDDPHDLAVLAKAVLDNAAKLGDCPFGKPQRVEMPIRNSAYDAANVTVIIVGHIIGAAVAATGIWALEWLIRWLWGHEDPLLFDRIPLRYVFDAADLAIIGAFIFRGVRTLVKE